MVSLHSDDASDEIPIRQDRSFYQGRYVNKKQAYELPIDLAGTAVLKVYKLSQAFKNHVTLVLFLQIKLLITWLRQFFQCQNVVIIIQK